MRELRPEMHRIISIRPTDPGWRVDSLGVCRPAKFFQSKSAAEAYLAAAGAQYIPQTGKWEGGIFDAVNLTGVFDNIAKRYRK